MLGMSRIPRFTEPVTRKTVVLPDTIWDAINDIRKSSPGFVPSEAEVVRTLLREAIEARAMPKLEAPAKVKAPRIKR